MKMARRSLVTWADDSFIEIDHVFALNEGGFPGNLGGTPRRQGRGGSAGDAARGLGGLLLTPSVIIRAASQIYADLLRPTRFPEITILSQMVTAQLPSANSGETNPH
jgi:hypothetical protein